MKPETISEIDWKLLCQKYPDDINKALEKLRENYPVQYLIGDVEFLNTIINVDERVLIPRFETEFLVEKTIQKIKRLGIKKPNILELGTGSGCISIALKKNLECNITCVDISQPALDLAIKNAQQNNVVINTECIDMLKISYEHYNVIISNPPYVGEQEEVGPETKYEPQNALFAKNNGLYYYEEILKKVSCTENQPNLIAFEIGYQQGNNIRKFTNIYLSNYECVIEKDLTGKDRYAFITKK